MKSPIKPKAAARAFLDPFETLNTQVAKPIMTDVFEQLGGSAFSGFGKPQTIGQEDLARARKAKELKAMESQDEENSRKIYETIQTQYRTQETSVAKEQRGLREQVVELQSEVIKLAKSAGVDTKAHLEALPKKIGVIDIKRLTTIVRFLRIKATDAKSASELVSQRSNAKRPTGMLAWVSGKQMQIHEQGTLQLQG